MWKTLRVSLSPESKWRHQVTKEVKASLPFCQLESPLVDKDICGRF